jgi:hypothetical protein
MVCHTSGCLGEYDFDQIVYFARKRFIEGYNTITLLEQAQSDQEKEEIALVAMLDIEDNEIRDIQLYCKFTDKCKISTCRAKLKEMIKNDFATIDFTTTR